VDLTQGWILAENVFVFPNFLASCAVEDAASMADGNNGRFGVVSPVHMLAGLQWRLLAWPRGFETPEDGLALFLEITPELDARAAAGQRSFGVLANFAISVVPPPGYPENVAFEQVEELTKSFDSRSRDWGFQRLATEQQVFGTDLSKVLAALPHGDEVMEESSEEALCDALSSQTLSSGEAASSSPGQRRHRKGRRSRKRGSSSTRTGSASSSPSRSSPTPFAPENSLIWPDGSLHVQVRIHIDADALAAHDESADKEEESMALTSTTPAPYLGLENQGATCYMNSVLQALFNLPAFRRAVYQMPTEDDMQTGASGASVPLALQRLFYRLQFGDTASTTTELTRSFGWDAVDAFTQHDVQEMLRVLTDNIEEKMKGTPEEGAIEKLFRGQYINFIECIDVDYRSTRKEYFYDISLNVRGCSTLEESFEKFLEVEVLEGDNAYAAEGHGKQRARKGIRFGELPPVLHLQLKRFEYDPYIDNTVKVNDRFAFPEHLDLRKHFKPPGGSPDPQYSLYGVLVHSGDVSGGHYYAFLRPTTGKQWIRFDDERIKRVRPRDAINANFGGVRMVPSFRHNSELREPDHLTNTRRSSVGTSAYMLIYVRVDSEEALMAPVAKESIPPSIGGKLEQEEREAVEQRRLVAEAGNYVHLDVLQEGDLSTHWLANGVDVLAPEAVAQAWTPRMPAVTYAADRAVELAAETAAAVAKSRDVGARGRGPVRFRFHIDTPVGHCVSFIGHCLGFGSAADALRLLTFCRRDNGTCRLDEDTLQGRCKLPDQLDPIGTLLKRVQDGGGSAIWYGPAAGAGASTRITLLVDSTDATPSGTLYGAEYDSMFLKWADGLAVCLSSRISLLRARGVDRLDEVVPAAIANRPEFTSAKSVLIDALTETGVADADSLSGPALANACIVAGLINLFEEISYTRIDVIREDGKDSAADEASPYTASKLADFELGQGDIVTVSFSESVQRTLATRELAAFTSLLDGADVHTQYLTVPLVYKTLHTVIYPLLKLLPKPRPLDARPLDSDAVDVGELVSRVLAQSPAKSGMLIRCLRSFRYSDLAHALVMSLVQVLVEHEDGALLRELRGVKLNADMLRFTAFDSYRGIPAATPLIDSPAFLLSDQPGMKWQTKVETAPEFPSGEPDALGGSEQQKDVVERFGCVMYYEFLPVTRSLLPDLTEFSVTPSTVFTEVLEEQRFLLPNEGTAADVLAAFGRTEVATKAAAPAAETGVDKEKRSPLIEAVPNDWMLLEVSTTYSKIIKLVTEDTLLADLATAPPGKGLAAAVPTGRYLVQPVTGALAAVRDGKKEGSIVSVYHTLPSTSHDQTINVHGTPFKFALLAGERWPATRARLQAQLGVTSDAFKGWRFLLMTESTYYAEKVLGRLPTEAEEEADEESGGATDLGASAEEDGMRSPSPAAAGDARRTARPILPEAREQGFELHAIFSKRLEEDPKLKLCFGLEHRAWRGRKRKAAVERSIKIYH
jgi:ubiquitin C-terminal hydrolase